jgi:hypothetical protein
LYFLGITHWLFFFFFVDYYTYSNIAPTVEIREVLNKESSIEQTIADINKTRKDDIELLKSFVTNKEVNKLFQYKYFTAHDWVKENKYQDLIGESLRTFTLPYHVPNLPKIVTSTERFLGAVHYTISPQTMLLYFINSQVFTVINLLLMYSVGFFGCILIKRRYKLGLLSFTFLFLLFNFNGYWVEKVTIYGAGYMGYFFMPFVIDTIFRIKDLDQSDIKGQYRLGLLLGVFSAAILFQGSFHLFVEIITFIIIWGIVNFRYWQATLASLVATFSLGMVRLLPAAISYGVEPNPHAAIWGGYRHPQQIIDAFVDLRTHLDEPIYSWWEYSLYISVIGLFFLVYLGMLAPFLRLEWSRFKGWKALVVPCFVILIISFRQWKHFIIPNFIPLLNAESMTTRYMIIPLVIIIFISAINFQGFMERYWQWKKVKYVMFLSISALALFLFNHSRLWRMHKVQNEFYWYNSWHEGERVGHERVVDIQLYINNNMNDTIYIVAFWIGLTVSILSLFLAVWLLWRGPLKISKITI